MTLSFYANNLLLSKIDCLDGFEKSRLGSNWFQIEIEDEDEESQNDLRDLLGECSCAWQEETNRRNSKHDKKPRRRTYASKASW